MIAVAITGASDQCDCPVRILPTSSIKSPRYVQDKESSVLLASHMEALRRAAIQEQMGQWKIWEKKAVLIASLVSAYSANCC